MKKLVYIFSLIHLLCLCKEPIYGQQEKGIIGEDNWLKYWTEFRPKTDILPEPTQILSGEIKGDTVTLKKREVYLLLGDVFVTNNTKLVIEPGTLIFADYKTKASLTITVGSSIHALGEQTDPIIFTSNRGIPTAGDWGGIVILGDAPLNKISDKDRLDFGLAQYTPGNLIYGGSNLEGNSGTMNYVRIEYAGKRTKEHGFYDALGLYGVGNQTSISNVMVTSSKGNSFYVAGGNVNLTNLVSYKASRSDFKFDYGAQIKISNSLAVRSPYDSAAGGAASLHATSHSDKRVVDLTKSQTSVEASNMTLLNLTDDLKSAIEVGLIHEAVYVDVHTSLDMSRSVLSGFDQAVNLSRNIVLNDENLKRVKFKRMYFNSCEGNIFIDGRQNNDDLENWYGNSAFQNVYSKDSDREAFIDPKNMRNPDFRLRINKIIASQN